MRRAIISHYILITLGPKHNLIDDFIQLIAPLIAPQGIIVISAIIAM